MFFYHFQAQIHLLGNLIIWYTATISLIIYCALLVFYLLRRRRLCYDLDQKSWNKFLLIGEVFLTGYLFHYIPYFFVERTLFLHHYLPAFTFKVLLMTALLEHLHYLLKYILKLRFIANVFVFGILVWLMFVLHVFKKFSVLSYGTTDLSTNDILSLRWKDTWDFIVHKSWSAQRFIKKYDRFLENVYIFCMSKSQVYWRSFFTPHSQLVLIMFLIPSTCVHHIVQ